MTNDNTTHNRNIAKDLHSLATFLYNNADELPPANTPQEVKFYAFPNGENKEELSRIAHVLGTFEKDATDSCYHLTKKFGGDVSLNFVFIRDYVCTPHVVGTKTVRKLKPSVTSQHTDDDYEEVEEDIIEWDCPSLLSPTELEEKL